MVHDTLFSKKGTHLHGAIGKVGVIKGVFVATPKDVNGKQDLGDVGVVLHTHLLRQRDVVQLKQLLPVHAPEPERGLSALTTGTRGVRAHERKNRELVTPTRVRPNNVQHAGPHTAAPTPPHMFTHRKVGHPHFFLQPVAHPVHLPPGNHCAFVCTEHTRRKQEPPDAVSCCGAHQYTDMGLGKAKSCGAGARPPPPSPQTPPISSVAFPIPLGHVQRLASASTSAAEGRFRLSPRLATWACSTRDRDVGVASTSASDAKESDRCNTPGPGSVPPPSSLHSKLSLSSTAALKDTRTKGSSGRGAHEVPVQGSTCWVCVWGGGEWEAEREDNVGVCHGKRQHP
jgi:hypothetical protein